ncbi:MAG: DUF4192 family protein [Janthinobacterium lividum]
MTPSRTSRSASHPEPLLHDPPLLRLRGPADLIAILPYRIGFHPAQSIVLVELTPPTPGGPGTRLGAVVRTDLSPCSGALVRDADGVARTAVEALIRASPSLSGCKATDGEPVNGAALGGEALGGARFGSSAATEVVVVCFDDTGARGPRAELTAGPAGQAVIERAVTLLVERGVPGPEVLLVNRGRWRSFGCSHTGCCPPQGHRLRRADGDRVAAQAVALGLTAAPDRARALPPTEPFEAALLARARTARTRADLLAWGPSRRRAVLRTWARERGRYEEAVTLTRVAADVCGELLAACDDLWMRDALLLDAAPEPLRARALDALVAGPPPATGWCLGPPTGLCLAPDDETRCETDDVLVGELVGEAMRAAPDPNRARAAAALAVDVARHAQGRDGSGAWALAAWLHLSGGDGVRAGACADEALRVDEDHRLAALVRQAVRSGVRPSGRRS